MLELRIFGDVFCLLNKKTRFSCHKKYLIPFFVHKFCPIYWFFRPQNPFSSQEALLASVLALQITAAVKSAAHFALMHNPQKLIFRLNFLFKVFENQNHSMRPLHDFIKDSKVWNSRKTRFLLKSHTSLNRERIPSPESTDTKWTSWKSNEYILPTSNKNE